MKYRIGILVALAFVVGGFWFVKSHLDKPLDYEALKALGLLELDEPIHVDFNNLIAEDGNEFSKEQLLGKWTFAFFGYVNCPDVCPGTMGILQTAESTISKTISDEKQQQFQGMFVSVDPIRDTQTEVKEFVEHFSPNFIGLTGTEAAISKLAAQVNIGYRKIPSASELEYLVEHTERIVIFDPEGDCYGYIKPRTDVFDTSQLVQLFKELERSE